MRFKKGLLLNPSLKALFQRFSYRTIFQMISAFVGLFSFWSLLIGMI